MRWDEGDVATLTGWAKDDRQERIGAIWTTPLLPVFDWFIIDQTWIYYEFTLFIVIPLVFYIGLGLHGFAFVGLAKWVPGPGAPHRILAGAEPSVTVEAVVHRDDGDDPSPISVAFTNPAKNRLEYLHLGPEPWLTPGAKATLVGFGSRRRPFRQGMLLVAETEQRLWVRKSPSTEERNEYVEPTD